MATIYDIAKQAGVSTATVSRVLNKSARVSEDTRARVLAIMEAAEYAPNAFAQGLCLKSIKTVGILCADCSDPFFSTAIYHLETGLRQNGYSCILTCTGNELPDKQTCMQLLLNKQIDAAIVIGSNYMESDTNEQAYLLQAAEHVPIVMINCALCHENIFCIQNDPYASVFAVTHWLLMNGRQKPLFLYQGRNFYNQEKLRGFLDAAEAAGITEPAVLECPRGLRESIGLLKEHCPSAVDAVVTSHDELAVAFLKYAGSMQLCVPERCSVVGHGDLPLAQCCEPELTTIDLHVPQLCEVAVAHLMHIFAGEKPPHNTVISGDLCVRGTTRHEICENETQ